MTSSDCNYLILILIYRWKAVKLSYIFKCFFLCLFTYLQQINEALKARLHMRFCRALQRNFCRKYQLAAILLRFRVRYLLQFLTNRCQVASSFEHIRNMSDIAARNRTKSPLVYTRYVMMQLERDKNCIDKRDKSCMKNRMCKRAFKPPKAKRSLT